MASSSFKMAAYTAYFLCATIASLKTVEGKLYTNNTLNHDLDEPIKGRIITNNTLTYAQEPKEGTYYNESFDYHPYPIAPRNYSNHPLNSSPQEPEGWTYSNDTIDYIEEGTFINATTCKEFLKGSVLNVTQLLETDWTIFYFWVPEEELPHGVKFTVPSESLVHRFKATFTDLKPPVNWNRAQYFMETSVDFNVLLLASSRPGLFRSVPTVFLDVDIKPLIMTALKTVGNYLGLVDCKYRLGYAMAPSHMIPKRDEIEAAAAQLKFYNSEYGFTYYDIQDKLKNGTLSAYDPLNPDVEDDDDVLVVDQVEPDMNLL